MAQVSMYHRRRFNPHQNTLTVGTSSSGELRWEPRHECVKSRCSAVSSVSAWMLTPAAMIAPRTNAKRAHGAALMIHGPFERLVRAHPDLHLWSRR